MTQTTVFDNLSLMDLSAEFEKLEQMVIDLEGEVTPEIEEQMHDLLAADRGKVDRYVWRIRAWRDEIDACEDAIKTLQAKKRAAHKRVHGLKGMAMWAMKVRGVSSLAGELWKMRIQLDGGKLSLRLNAGVEVDSLPRWYQTVKTNVTANTDTLREALEGDDPVTKQGAENFAHLLPRGESIRIS